MFDGFSYVDTGQCSVTKVAEVDEIQWCRCTSFVYDADREVDVTEEDNYYRVDGVILGATAQYRNCPL